VTQAEERYAEDRATVTYELRQMRTMLELILEVLLDEEPDVVSKFELACMHAHGNA
jgi:hypothetical protein